MKSRFQEFILQSDYLKLLEMPSIHYCSRNLEKPYWMRSFWETVDLLLWIHIQIIFKIFARLWENLFSGSPGCLFIQRNKHEKQMRHVENIVAAVPEPLNCNTNYNSYYNFIREQVRSYQGKTEYETSRLYVNATNLKRNDCSLLISFIVPFCLLSYPCSHINVLKFCLTHFTKTKEKL